MPMRMISLLDLAGKNLIFNENWKLCSLNLSIVSSLIIWNKCFLIGVQHLPILLGIVKAKLLAFPLPHANFVKEKTVSAIVVLCCETAYLRICGKHKRLLVLNPAVGVSFLTVIKFINHTAFMESRHFVIVFIFVVFRLVVD